jgi:hypothetical protein
MAIKRMIEIKLSPDDIFGDMFDLWEFRSIQRAEQYNSVKGEMEYLILVNKNAIGTNYNDLSIIFDNKDSRDAEIMRIKEILNEDEDIIIM